MVLTVGEKATFDFCIPLLPASLAKVSALLESTLSDHLKEVGADDKTTRRCLGHFERCLRYTVSGGKMTRGATVPLTVASLDLESTVDSLQTATAVGCCLEVLQAAFLVLDDVMDNSVLRRGKPCWHLCPGVGIANAVNDGLFLENAVFAALRLLVPVDKRLGVLELVNETVMRTLVGQNLDVSTLGVDDFHPDRYKAIIRSKTSFYSFWLPIALGYHLSNVELSEHDLQITRNACILLGEYFQIQDDFLDFSATPADLGKVGTDIEEGKCTWLAVEAFARGSDEQRATLRECFAMQERTRADVQTVRGIYEAIGIRDIYHNLEQEMSLKVDLAIGAVSHTGLQHVLRLLYARIHKRNK